MKKIFLPFLVTFILSSFFIYNFYERKMNDKSIGNLNFVKDDPVENPIARSEHDFMMLRDPVTNEIPQGIYQREQEFAAKLPKRSETVLFKNGQAQNVQALSWTERGPNNVGGRTRAFAADKRDASIMIAGGVSGGIWRSTNEGASWVKTTTNSQLHSVTCIAQDPRTGQEDTWYAGSGEGSGNSAGASGSAPYLGNGIFKSTNNGLTWAQLPSTIVGTLNSFDYFFDFVHNIVVSPVNGYIFVAASKQILRSIDGGANWSILRGSSTTISSSHSEVQITSTGIVYAAIRSGLTDGGIWKSTNNGDTWSDITPVSGTNAVANFPTDYRRVVIGIAPSVETTVYIFAYTPNDGKPGEGGSAADGHSFWKYDDALAGTAQWVDRSSNLPTWSGFVGGLTTQGGYDMVLHVKYDDPNFVIIGGTNLFRSTDGISSSMGITSANWIGGYAVTNDISQYAAHHPDLHSGFFKSSSSIVYYSGHDGGLSKTTDITADPVVWTDLDQSYNTSQFYSISIAPESGSNYLLGGLQDNGNQVVSSAGLANWVEVPGGGDGTINEVAPAVDNRIYASQQNGRMLSFSLNLGSYFGDFAPPSGSSNQVNQLFVNPFALDPINSDIMYYAGGNAGAPPASGTGSNTGLWRNDNLTGITAPDPVSSWTQLTSTLITDGSKVSAIGISNMNSSNVVYYGTTLGIIKRVDNANTGSTPTTSADLSAVIPNGFVNCIAVDPTNSQNALVVLSNYNIQSLWYTDDGGATWTDVEGNLSGTSGPSIRWAIIFPISGVTNYIIGTSIGIYSSFSLSGVTTAWTQEASTSIGNVVCTMLDWRIDSGSLPKSVGNASLSKINAVGGVTVAASTHGRGVFTSQLTNPLPVELVTFTGYNNNNNVELYWETATEINNYGFEIERKIADQENWETIDFISGAGNSNSSKEYNFIDKNPIGGNKFFYRLKQIDIDGQFEYSSRVEIELLVNSYKLSQNYPNPFNPSTKINYTIPETADIKLEIYSLTGELVTEFSKLKQNQGNYSFDFNAAKYGNISSGMYFYRISASGLSGNNFVQTKKMMLVK